MTKDLTERRRHEQEQLRLVKAEEAIRLRDEFLSLASHELKTPLTELRMQIDGLHRRLDASDETLAVGLRGAAQSSDRLTGLIESIIDASRLATGKFGLKVVECDLAATAVRAVEAFRPTAANAAARSSSERPAGSSGPGTKLGSSKSSAIFCRTRSSSAAAARRGVTGAGRPWRLIEIRDHGPGLPPDVIDGLLQRFEWPRQAPLGGGLGLGLYLVQEYVAAHGGSIFPENADGGGARFRVNLPVAPSAEGTETAFRDELRN